MSYERSDLIEFIESGGVKKNLLWSTEEDEILTQNVNNPGNHLYKLILRLKGPERIERRLKFLKVI